MWPKWPGSSWLTSCVAWAPATPASGVRIHVGKEDGEYELAEIRSRLPLRRWHDAPPSVWEHLFDSVQAMGIYAEQDFVCPT